MNSRENTPSKDEQLENLQHLKNENAIKHTNNANLLFPPPSPLLRQRAISINHQSIPPTVYISSVNGHMVIDQGQHDPDELKTKGYIKQPLPR